MKNLNCQSRSKVIATMNGGMEGRSPARHAERTDCCPVGDRRSGSWRGYLPLLALCFAAIWPVNTEAARAEAKKEPVDQSLTAFKLIADRNIFNANRRARSAGGPPAARPERQVKIEAFSLTGTLLHDGGMFAFFDGTESHYRKVLKSGDAIGGHKIVEVCANSVKLEADDSNVELPIGMQLRRRDEEPWQVIVGTAASSSSSSSSAPSSSFAGRDRNAEFGGRDRNADAGRRDRGSDSGRRVGADTGRRDRGSFRSGNTTVEAEAKPAETPVSDISADEVLKRMMEKRAQELK